ncbi:MAG TPA: DUF3014 domain-containing protein [Ramlibacter sp.]|nr:DUF3014 domain-containing protein [Ramlibacter sp.]
MKARNLLLTVVIGGAVLAGVALWYNQQGRPGMVPEREPAAPPVAAQAPAPTPPASEPAVRYPVRDESAHPIGPPDINAGLIELLGRKAVATFVLTDDFPRRLVATVDNLGRSHAPSVLWPIAPTPGRFTVDESGAQANIAAENSSRYTPFVLLVETIDIRRAVDFYRSVYPLLQNAYQELGFPRRYFNDRLIEVIDLLLATPEPQQAPSVQLLEVRGPVASQRPWVRYEFTDPALQSLAAGQKILIRVGLVNERRLKAKLRDFREALTSNAAAR